ncbi:hypothetical protein BH11ACT6_BH11ACT6_53510 [soil metagenome]
MSDRWIEQLVKATPVESLDGFVSIEFGGKGWENPVFKFRNGQLWKSACSIKVWDDGRVTVRAESHLTAHQRRIVGGLAEEYWRGGPERAKRERWRRIRKSASRPTGAWATCFWVRAELGEPGYAVAHADMRHTVVQSHPSAFKAPAQQWIDEGAEERVVME